MFTAEQQTILTEAKKKLPPEIGLELQIAAFEGRSFEEIVEMLGGKQALSGL